jgi:hypothetical protein
MATSQKARLEIARKHLEAWLSAELEVTTHQSYTIGSRSLTKADLSEIGERIKYWTNEVSRLENIEARGGRNRVFRVVPRDL